MATIQKTPMYVYDEPASYNDFSGGINTDPLTENLYVNQLRDALNVHYDNKGLRTRYGASKHLDLLCDEDIHNIQGAFLFTLSNPYVVIAANGKIYTGLYQPKGKTYLTRLPIILNIAVSIGKLNTSNQFENLQVLEILQDDISHEGYVYKTTLPNLGGPTTETLELIFQNKKRIEALPYNNQLYIASGTRFLKIIMQDNVLRGEVILPYVPSGIEYQQLGPNLLSPYPTLHINPDSSGVKTSIHGIIPIKQLDGTYLLQAIMTYEPGKSANDYLFKWESVHGNSTAPVPLENDWGKKLIFNCVKGANNLPISQGRTTIRITEHQATLQRYRVTFAAKFERDLILETKPLLLETLSTELDMDGVQEYQDYIIDKVDGEWFGSATSILLSAELTRPKTEWVQLQSCTRISGDGNKLLLYDDKFNSGNWWKTIIDNPGYITYRGGLNFKTSFNEQLTKVISFKGIIVCFAYNPYLGGSISVVTGNGDDYPDETYSPYSRRIVTKSISTDNPESVQVADNIILFKYKDTIYMIEGSELNSEIISVQSVNDVIKLSNDLVAIPWEDNNCISEITRDYYALIWGEQTEIIDGEAVMIHPGTRVKMYYKLGFNDQGKIIFPWLRDEATTFNVEHILYIAGVPYHLYDNLLVTYEEKYFKDLSQPYQIRISPRGFDLNYPKFMKSIYKMIMYYHRGKDVVTTIDTKVYNESGYDILPEPSDESKEDIKTLYEGNVIEPKRTKLDKTIIDVKVFSSSIRFNAMLVFVDVLINGGTEFSIASLTFLYKTVGLPKSTPQGKYGKVVKRGEDLIVPTQGNLSTRAGLILGNNLNTGEEIITQVEERSHSELLSAQQTIRVAHEKDFNNPHQVTAAQLGLGPQWQVSKLTPEDSSVVLWFRDIELVDGPDPGGTIDGGTFDANPDENWDGGEY